MSEDIYCIDSSSIIDMNRIYPMDVFQGIWDEVNALAKTRRIIAPAEVFDEIRAGDDDLVPWTKKHKKMFIPIQPEHVSFVQSIQKQFPFLAHPEKTGPNADPWLIAIALSMNKSAGELFKTKCLIVTEESKTKPNRLPFVCKYYGIECINNMGLFRREKWKF